MAPFRVLPDRTAQGALLTAWEVGPAPGQDRPLKVRATLTGYYGGLSVNLSRSGPSLTVGVRGAHVTLGRGRVTKTVGLPGTGLFYTSRQGTHTGYHSAKHNAPITPSVQAAADRSAERTIGLIVLSVTILAVFLLLHS